jgi:purine-cytosine permease-like protein
MVVSIEQYEVFLLLIGAIFVPLFGVVLTDYYIVKRQKYTEQMLYVRQKGLGIGVPAIIAWTLGVLLNYILSPISPIYIPQLPAIGATIPSLAAASVIYLAITKMQRRQRGEVMTKI